MAFDGARAERITESQISGVPGHPSFGVLAAFEESEGGTKLSFWMRLETTEELETKLAGGVVEAGNQTQARLAEYLTGGVRD